MAYSYSYPPGELSIISGVESGGPVGQEGRRVAKELAVVSASSILSAPSEI